MASREQATAAAVTGLPLDKAKVHNHLIGGGFGRRLDVDGVTQALRINEAPRIEVHLVENREEPGGIGEPGTATIAPAVVNAIFALTGKRLRKLPINTDELRSA